MAEHRKDYQDTNGVGVGSLPNAAALLGVTVQEIGNEVFQQQIFTFKDVIVPVTDTGGVNGGFGSLQLYAGIQGFVNYLGTVMDLAVVAAAGIGAAATVKAAVGSVAEAANDTLDTTSADMLASTNGVLTGSAGTLKAGNSTPVQFDGSTTAKDIFLNIGVADAGITASSSVRLNGTIKVTRVMLGDK